MKTSLPTFAGLIFIAALLQGCLTAPIEPPTGTWFSNYSVPLEADFDQTDVGLKTGESSSMSILGLFAWGDASVEAAMREGSLSEAMFADYRYLNVLGVFQKFRIIVAGY